MPKTIQQILLEVRARRGPLSLIQLRRYLKSLGIQALGIRQRPQRYPANTTQKVLDYLGLAGTNGSAKVPTMARLRQEREKARAK